LGERSLGFRYARTCYRHPAGQVGVAITDWLLDIAWVLPAPGGYRLSNSGLLCLHALGARSHPLETGRIYGFCADLTERRPHLGGDLGAALTLWLLDRAWVVRSDLGRRLLEVTPAGHAGLASLGVKLPERSAAE
jgi:hypothetical protein